MGTGVADIEVPSDEDAVEVGVRLGDADGVGEVSVRDISAWMLRALLSPTSSPSDQVNAPPKPLLTAYASFADTVDNMSNVNHDLM